MKNQKNLEVKNAMSLAMDEILQIANGKDKDGDLSIPGMKLKANNAIAILKKVNTEAKKQSADNDKPFGEKLINWIDDTRRGKAAATFPEGAERQIATRFENLFERLKTLNKSD